MEKEFNELPAILNGDRSFNRFNDAFVKFLFSTEKHKKFLIDLLNAVFDERRPQCVSGRVVDVTFEDRELPTFHIDEKYGRLDIRAITGIGQIVNIEVQTTIDKSLKDRNVFYFSKIYSAQQVKGLAYFKLKPVVIINLLAVNYFPERQNYITSFSLREDEDHEQMSDKATFIYIEAQKCTELGDKNKSRLTRWMTYLTYPSQEAVFNLAQEDQIIAEAMEAEKVFFRTHKEMREYEAREKYEMDMISAEENGRIEALLDTAKKMIAAGVSIEQIKKFTNLDDKQLAEIL